MGVLKRIRHGWGVFTHHSRLVLGDGSRIKFLSVIWCGNNVLKDSLSIFWFAIDKEASLVDLMVKSGDQVPSSLEHHLQRAA